MVLNIVIVGVGGQGILSLANLIGNAFLSKDIKVLIAETHGLSQRGGSVIVHVRVGSKVYAPLIPKGSSDVMIALELTEAGRYSDFLNRKSVLLLNDKIIRPTIPKARAPEREEVLNHIRQVVSEDRLFLINASEVAVKFGNPVGANVVLFGFASRMFEEAGVLDYGVTSGIIRNFGSPRFREVNLKLFEYGYRRGEVFAGSKIAEEIRKKIFE